MAWSLGILFGIAAVIAAIPLSGRQHASLPHGIVMTPAASPLAGAGHPTLYAAVLPEHQAGIIAATADRLPRYEVTATLLPPTVSSLATPSRGSSPVASPDARLAATPVAGTPSLGNAASVALPLTFVGTMKLSYVNGTGRSQSELYLRLYPNDSRYGDGALTLRDVRVDGTMVAPMPYMIETAPATPAATPVAAPVTTPVAVLRATPVVFADSTVDSTLVRIPLPVSLPPRGITSLSIGFTTTVPIAPTDGTGLFGFYPETGTWVVAHPFPLLAGYDPETGWDLSTPAPWADPVFSNFALFDVALTTPANLVLVTSGIAIEETSVGTHIQRRYVTGPAREFTVVADKDFITSRRRVGGTTVTAYANPDHAAGNQEILTYATQALKAYNDLFGPYPYAELDVVEVPSIVGFEFPHLVVIGSQFYDGPAQAGSRVGAVEFLVAHEVAHQWWYGVVGNNQHRHAFLDEGVTEYASFLYFERQHGAKAVERHVNLGLRLRYATMVFSEGDQIVDQPSSAFPNDGAYFTTVYWKAALGFAALRAEVGDAAFFAGLRAYAARERFQIAVPAELRAAFERAAEQNLETFWHSWFEAPEGRVSIIVESGPGPPVAATPILATPVS